MARIYIASRYSSRFALRAEAAKFRDAGHEITSSWLYRKDEGDYDTATEGELAHAALTDFHEVVNSDFVISYTGIGGHGGRHAEFGIALAKGIPQAIIGRREHVFHYLPHIEVLDTTELALEWIRQYLTSQRTK